MAVNGYVGAVAEIGRNPVRHKFSASVENEQAGATWDGRTCLVKPNSQARRGKRKSAFFPVQLAPPILSVSHISTVLYCIPIVSVGKEWRTERWPMVKPGKAEPVTGIALGTTGPVPVDSRLWTPSVRNCATP